MRVAVAGVGGQVGHIVVPALVAAGHSVVGLSRSQAGADLLGCVGAEAYDCSIFDHASLVGLLDGADVLCSFAPRLPAGPPLVRSQAWRTHDVLRGEGVGRLVEAAREARVRRVVHESVSFLYADNGDDWIREDAPLDITAATEPASVGESHVQAFACGARTGVVLRLGSVVGSVVGDEVTAPWWPGWPWWPWGSRAVPGWAHVVHADDLAPAVLAALHAPSGTYNVGAAPVRRTELVAGLGAAATRNGGLAAPLLRRVAARRIEPLLRSLRVCSEHFTSQSGWSPRRAEFDPSWFEPAAPSGALR